MVTIAKVRDMLAEAQTASGYVKGSDAFAVYTFRARKGITELLRAAAVEGRAEEVENAYYQVATWEAHRLPKMVDSLHRGRVYDVMRALLAYQPVRPDNGI